MALLTSLPRGTADLLPAESWKWQRVEQTLRRLSALAGVEEIRTPTFEHTELFHRSVGDTTDVVQKEMYTFEDKGGRSVTLRPEGTAGAVRAFVQNGLAGAAASPVRLYYFTSCFRYEKPQAGRLREFHQYGVEMFGSADAAADAELIAFAQGIFDALDLAAQVRLEINSIGCAHCRADYHRALREYFSARRDELCETCQDRLERNPMRILDCKSPVCAAIAAGAPKILDFLCEDCQAHFDALRARLDALGVAYTVNPSIVRGLDYYNRTVFEFVTDRIGAQATVLGGGRYDTLVETLGGPSVPALGFAMGLERLQLLLENVGFWQAAAPPEGCRIYLASLSPAASDAAMKLAHELRRAGIAAQSDLCGRSLRAQMKYAGKLGAPYCVVLGDDELASGVCRLKDMRTGEEKETALAALAEAVRG